MTHSTRAVRVGGMWFAVASFLIIVTLALHGPIAPDPGDQMTKIADATTRWAVAHWAAAAGFSLYTVAGLLVLTAGSRLTEGWWTMTAWALIPVAALWTMTTAVVEATVVVEAVASGRRETFAAWWAFAEGKAHGFAFMALAVAVVAGNEARSPGRFTPAWSAGVASVAGVASFAGWALGMWFEVAIGSLLWVIASLVMSVWALWFGAALARRRAM